MPDYAMSDREVEAVTTYLLGLKGLEVPAAYTLPLGEKTSTYVAQGKFGRVRTSTAVLPVIKSMEKAEKWLPTYPRKGAGSIRPGCKNL